MKTKHTFYTALRGLRTHPSRSALTILGIVIGVAAIIVVMALGNGAQSLIVGQISGLGAETVIVQPGSGLSEIQERVFSQSLTDKDVKALEKKSNVSNLEMIAPMVMVPGTIEYKGQAYSPMIIGASAEFLSDTFDIYPKIGVPFSGNDIEQNARVVVIGSEIKEEIFGPSDAVGENIQIQGKKFRVVGVFPSKGQVGGLDINNLIVLPYTTAQVLTGTNFYNQIFIKADSTENVEKLVFDIEATLRDTHGLDIGEEADFNVQTQQNLVDQIQSVISILTAFLGAVVAISLIVGGIGIMNIMLVSVTERTKEIGLRKALGATRSDILRQFLFEAVMLTSSGGLVGITLGALISWGAAIILAHTVAEGWTFVFPINAAILGFGVSASVGLIFGIYPASEASKKSPMEALRYE